METETEMAFLTAFEAGLRERNIKIVRRDVNDNELMGGYP